MEALEREDLIMCDQMVGFYIVPNIERFSVSRDGFVYDRILHTYADVRTSKNDKSLYLRVVPGHYHVHVLIAETFLDKSHVNSEDKAIVNHKNGITIDNRSCNLEWTTYSGNSIHAYKTGLRNDNIPVLCKDLRTGFITRYYSYQECARAFNINAANVHHYFKGKSKVFQRYYVLVKEGDVWPNVDSSILDNVIPGFKNPILLIKDSDKIILDSGTMVMKHIGIKSRFLYESLRKTTLFDPRFFMYDGYTIMYLYYSTEDQRESAINISEQYSKKYKPKKVISVNRPPVPIEVIDLTDNSCKVWESSEEFSKSLGVLKNTFQKHIWKNNGIFKSRYKVKYLN